VRLDKLLRRIDDDWDDDDRERRRPADGPHPDRHDSYPPKRRKKGWLSDMFEMD
jgi:Zn-finger nucleic acid-binding protein